MPLHDGCIRSDEVPIDPPRMCGELCDWLDTLRDPIAIGDGGDIVVTAAKIMPVESEGAWGRMARPRGALYG